MNIPKEYKGPIYIFWSVEYSFLHFSESEAAIDGYILIGNKDIEVGFDIADALSKAVDALRAKNTQIRAELQHSIDIIDGKIESLLAIEHDGGAKSVESDK